MKQITAFTKKEFMEIIRTGKATILLIIFVIFGILNPAFAKLTPWLYEMLSDSLQEQGISIGNVAVTAMTSWEQYYKNMSMEFIVFAVMFCGILTSEFQKGTLINMLTKGLSRWKVIAAKSIAVFVCWSLCYWLCFGITYGYTAYFWDNSIAEHLFFAAAGSYLFGIWLISLIMLCSAFLSSGTAVLLSTGVAYAVVYLLSMIPKICDYLPTKLTSGLELLTKAASVQDYTSAITVTAAFVVFAGAAAVIGFNRKRI